MSSNEYDEKIKQLFEEGAKLGASAFTEGLSDIPVAEQPPSIREVPAVSITPAFERPTTNPAHEIVAGKTSTEIPGWKNRIDGINNNSGHLWSKLEGNNDLLLARSKRPPQVLNLVPGKSEMSELAKSKIHLESALQDSQYQVEYLHRKLEESKETAKKQKEHFRGAIEQLQNKLQDTLAGRKQLLDLRSREMQEQEEMIHKLQVTLKDLAASNQMQEQALLDAHERMEIMQSRNVASEQALTQIRTILSAACNKEKRNFSSSSGVDMDALVSELVPDVLARNVENFLTSLQADADSLRNRVLQLESEINASKQTHAAEQMLASSEAADALKVVQVKFNNTIAEERARCDAAEKKVVEQTLRLNKVEEERDSQIRLVADNQEQITLLNKQVDEVRKQFCAEKGDLQAKLVAAEHDVRQLTDANEKLKVETAAQQQSIDKLQSDLNRANDDLHSEKEQRHDLWLKESDISKEVAGLRTSNQEKSAEVSRLREIVAQLRGELNTTVAREVNEAENAQRIKDEERISEITQSNTKLREELSSAKTALEAMERQISDAAIERTSALQFLQEKDQQVERLTAQLSLSDRKLIEVTEAKRTLDEKTRKLEREHSELSVNFKKHDEALQRARSVGDDRERISMQLRHQLESKTEAIRNLTKEADTVRFDKSRLEDELMKKSRDLEKAESRLKSQDEKIADYELRVSNLMHEKEKIAEDIRGIEREVERIVIEKGEVDYELKESRFQVGHLIEERDSLSKQLRSLGRTFEAESDRMKNEISRKKRELQEVQDTLHAVQSVDGRAARIAATMQNELTDKRALIDSLKSELAKVCERLENLQRENKALRKDLSAAEKKLSELGSSLNDANEEVRKKSKTANGYKLAVERLERALEKAATRNADAQAVIKRQETEMAQSHIRRGLELIDRRNPAPQQVDAPASTTPQFPAPPHSATTLQNVLVRLLTSMPSRDQAVHTATGISQPSGPMTSAGNDSNAKEVHKLLSEIRDQLASRDPRSTQSSPSRSKHSRKHAKAKGRKSRTRRAVLSADESSELDVVFAHTDVTSICSEPSDVTEIGGDIARERVVRTSSPRKHSRRFAADDDRAPSPVSILLGAGDSAMIPTKERPSAEKRALREVNDRLVGDKDVYDVMRKEEPRGRSLKSGVIDEAEDLCRQLQNRLEGLSEMGGRLEKQNRAAATLIKQQDKKLQKVRATGQKLR